MLNALLIIAVFSLGVYVGHYGLSREGLVYTGGAVRPVAPQPVQPIRPGQPGNILPEEGRQPRLPLSCIADERPQLAGRLLNISEGALEVAIEQGPRPVLIDAQTVYEDCDGSALSLDELQRGMVIAVYGVLGEDGRNLIAKRVIVLVVPQPTE